MGSDQSAGPESNEVARRLFEDAEHVHENSAGHSHEEHGHSKAGTAALALGALGVVYGDIGTSPLYSLKEAFTEKSHIMTVDRINVYGICSLAFWALVIIISIKYLLFVMRADNKGEGGILALTALVMPKRGPVAAKAGLLVALGIFGTALLYGDGIITPAISVLSAVEGLEEVSPAFSSWVIPIAIVILLGLFMVQKRGTGTVGKVFGPIMVAWFATLALLGLSKIIDEPGIIFGACMTKRQKLFQQNGHLHTIGGAKRIKLERVASDRQFFFMGSTRDRSIDAGESSTARLGPCPNLWWCIIHGIAHDRS
jgi:KUP system potassium uptake protein